MISQVGRADLITAKALLGDEGIEAVAALLGMSRVDSSNRDAERVDEPQVSPSPDPRTIDFAPQALTRESTECWRQTGFHRPDTVPYEPPQDHGLDPRKLGERSPKDFAAGPSTLMLLAPWSQLASPLSRALRSSRDSRRVDVDRIVKTISRGKFVRRPPMRRVVAWSSNIVVLVDVAARNLPCADDQYFVIQQLESLCGRAALRVRKVTDAPDRATVESWCDAFCEGAKVLYLGDLGFFDVERTRAAWSDAADILKERGHSLAALCPVPLDLASPELLRLWNVKSWERRRPGERLTRNERSLRAQRLLRLMSFALRIEPGLLREIRRTLPADEADQLTEMDAWNSSEMRGRALSGGAIDPDAADILRREARDDDRARIAKSGSGRLIAVLEIIRKWHGRLLPEVCAEELSSARSLEIELTDECKKACDHEDFLSIASAIENRATPAHWREPLEAYLRRVLTRVPGELMTSQTPVAESLRRAAAIIQKNDPSFPLPRGVDASFMGSVIRQRPERRRWGLWLVGSLMQIEPFGRRPLRGAATVGARLGEIETSLPYISVDIGDGSRGRQIHLDGGDLQTLPWPSSATAVVASDIHRLTWTRSSRPRWASSSGADEYGIWAAFRVKEVEVRMRWMPPGEYVQGSAETEMGREEREGPQRRVRFTKGFWLAETPTTQALWQALTGENPSRFKSPDRPVEQVSWDDCRAFINALNEQMKESGVEFALPSEAQWEYACRAGTTGSTYVGDVPILGEHKAPALDEIAWYVGNCAFKFELGGGYDLSSSKGRDHNEKFGGSHPVAQLRRNPWGLYDMLGNVWEWCADQRTAGEKYPAGDVVDPAPKTEGADRVIRGGGWGSLARDVRAAYRYSNQPDFRNVYLGFRLSEVGSS